MNWIFIAIFYESFNWSMVTFFFFFFIMSIEYTDKI